MKIEKDNMSVAAGLLAALAVPFVLLATAALQGMVLASIWAWYVVPTFALPHLSPVIAWGISLFIAVSLTRVQTKVDDRPSSPPLQSIGGAWLALVLVW